MRNHATQGGNIMNCENCGSQMIGDGYSNVLHCEYVDPDGVEADAGPIYCTEELEEETS
jgi:hypothetical protein